MKIGTRAAVEDSRVDHDEASAVKGCEPARLEILVAPEMAKYVFVDGKRIHPAVNEDRCHRRGGEVGR